jgi:flavin reductase (DIM6/NTAB) family NADH-FMN oxidoreductase RutF
VGAAVAAPAIAPVELKHAYRLMNTGGTVLVSAAHEGRSNVMAVAWNMPLDFFPCKVSVVLDKATYTRALVQASGQFVLSVPCAAQASLAAAVGSQSGREMAAGKFTQLAVPQFAVPGVAAPLVAGCIGWLVCKLIAEPHNQEQHDLFIGEVTAAWSDPRAFAQGKFLPLAQVPESLRTIHHLGAGKFVVPGSEIQG